MQSEIETLLKANMPDATIEVQANGNSFQLQIVSDQFEGLRAIKRQQLVYSFINEKIKSGEMHAVTMKIFTPEEWKKNQMFSL